MNKSKLIIFGDQGTAIEIKEIVDSHFSAQFMSSEIRYFDQSQRPAIVNALSKGPVSYIIGVADFQIRDECIKFCDSLGLQPVSIIHPSAVIFSSAMVSEGSYIGANVTVSSEAIVEAHCLININASIGHHAKISQNTVILPGARISGNVEIGSRTLVGSNSFIFQGVKVGEDNLIDALTYIDKNLDLGKLSSSKRTKTFPRPGF